MKEYSIIYRYIVHSSVAARGAAKARDSILPGDISALRALVGIVLNNGNTSGRRARRDAYAYAKGNKRHNLTF